MEVAQMNSNSILQSIDVGNFLPHSTFNGTDAQLMKSKQFKAFEDQSDDVAMPGTHKFYSNDTLERYVENLELMPEDWHYRNKEVTYTFNKQGYRCVDLDDVDWSNSVVMFGCSELMGTGLAEDERICYYLSQALDVPVINLGKAGTSIHFSYVNNLSLYKQCKKPLGVINQWTEFSRESYYGVDRYVTALVNHEPYQRKNFHMLKSLFGFDLDDWEHNRNTQAMCLINCVQNMWEGRTSYVEGTWSKNTADLLGCYIIDQIDDARDCYKGGNMFDDSIPGHLGPKTAKQTAEHYADLLNL